MTLKKGIVASQKSMRQQKVRFCGKRNPVEARLEKNALFKMAVNKPAEWREVHEMIKEISKGGVYKNELREFSDKLAHGNEAKTLSHKEGRMIAEAIHQEFCPELKKYKSSRNSYSKSAEYRTAKPNSVPAATASTGNTQITPMKMAIILNRARDISADSPDYKNSNDSTKRGGGFLGALGAVARNKRN